tara:strand:+ start:113 stop:364 length:252 start_codon:yes stop_codon:yes gene_type:complete
MSAETRRSILEAITELYSIDGEMFSLSNMLYGLFDGFDYSDQIHKSKEIFIIQEQNEALYIKLLDIIKAVKSYPKSETHNTLI